MLSRLKHLTLAVLLFSLSSSIAVAKQEVVEQTLAQAVSDTKVQADKLFEEGIQQYRTGKYPQALQTYEKVLSIRRQQEDKALIAKTLNNIGEAYYFLNIIGRRLF